MAIKVTKRATNEGPRYSISGLTFDQMFRIKNAMYAEAEKMKAISQGEVKDIPQMKADFDRFAEDARAVAGAVNAGI